MLTGPSRRAASAGRSAEVGVALVGLGLLAVAGFARQSWLDRHVLPSFFLPRPWYVAIESAVRAALAVAGFVVLFILRRPVARFLSRGPVALVSVVGAAVLAMAASEAVLRTVRVRPAEWLKAAEEPLRAPDARLGWTFAPSRTARVTIGGRSVEYALDAFGYRVRDLAHPVDPLRPSIVFTGESIMFGEGLAWDETVPAQVGAMLGVQGANLAVHGFSTDQAYLRAAAEWPRFRQPIALVTIFMTGLFGRNLDDDRPHLDPGLAWRPARPPGRVAALAKLVVPFRRDRTVERGVATTREALRATADLAQARGAASLIVVPQFGAESPAEAALRRRVLDGLGVPWVFVEIDENWRLAGDVHPNARAARLVAAAVAERLRRIARGRNPL